MFGVDDLRRILVIAADMDVSDLDFQTGYPLFANLYQYRHVMAREGKLLTQADVDAGHPLQLEIFTPEEMRLIANHLFKGAAAQEEMNRIRGGLNVAYMVEEKHAIGHERRGKKHRFRVNMVQGQTSGGETNVQITIRPLPAMVKFPEEYGIPDAIRENFFHPRGMVLVTGPTGSGKTTLLASMLRDALERLMASYKIITAEDPIEIVLQDVIEQMLCNGKIPRSFVHHAEVPTNLHGFDLSIREGMRRHPNIAMIGELRDKESISAALEMVLTGHMVVSTTHTIGVSATIDRLISGFSTEEKLIKKQDLVYSLRLIVSQILVPSADGKVTPLREWLVFDATVRDRLLKTSIEHLMPEMDRLLVECGRPMIRDVEDRYREGKITEAVYRRLEKDYALA
ncbi:Flp pilus assembly complex ATPase component TadA [Acidithiobacillus sp. MC6.1]|nr:Flp pilus assembly complex ATPase component TadA [Acidithiobacillus sp. MC6.1]